MSDTKPCVLTIDVRPGDVMLLGGVQVELLQKSGRLARLKVAAPSGLHISHQRAGALKSVLRDGKEINEYNPKAVTRLA